MVAYLDQNLFGTDAANEPVLADAVRGALTDAQRFPAVATGEGPPRMQLVWGPAALRMPGAVVATNMLFVVKDVVSGGLVVVVRGTPDLSLDAVFDEVLALRLVPWEPREPAGEARIARGVRTALDLIEAAVPCAGQEGCAEVVPGSGRTLHTFLSETQAQGDAPVMVTGHSFGGTLAHPLALWLHERGIADVSVTSFAAATAGDAGFAARHDAALGSRATRAWNQLDLLPHWWAPTTMRAAPKLYAACGIEPGLLAAWVDELLASEVRLDDYTHVLPATPALAGAACAPRIDGPSPYLQEILFQHIEGYVPLLDLAGCVDTTPAD